MRMNASTHRLAASEIIESEKLKYMDMLKKGLEMQKAILGADRKYFEKMGVEEMSSVKAKLENTVDCISRLIMAQNT